MQRVWFGVIIFAVMLPVLYFMGFAMNDLLKDIRVKKEQQRKRSSEQSYTKRDRSYLKAVK